MDPIADRFQDILSRIKNACRKAERSRQDVRLIAASKGQAPEKLVELFHLGQRDFGENYLQEWELKRHRMATALGDAAAEIRWHFIGHVQSKKAPAIVGACEWLQSLDSLKLATKLDQLAQSRGLVQRVLLEIKWPEESNKTGLMPDELRATLPDIAALKHLRLDGLMAIPPLTEDAGISRANFRFLKSLLDECNRCGVLNRPMTELSMGMSQDFEIAIEEGATQVRIGEALFGPRS